MFNYKIRQKKIDFFKMTNPYPALKYTISVGYIIFPKHHFIESSFCRKKKMPKVI